MRVERIFRKLVLCIVGFSAPLAMGAVCDADNDGDIDKNDIALIQSAIGSNVNAGDVRDADGDRKITVTDSRSCTLKCTKAACAIVTAVPNLPPIANSQNINTLANTPVAIVLSGSDPDANPITFSVLTNPLHGALTGTPPNLTYTPAAKFTGADSFTFKVRDGLLDSAAATVSITIPNRAPTANAQTVNTNANTALGITLTGTDPDTQAITFTVITNPAHGSLTGNAPNLSYTPATKFTGTDSFTFRVNDGSLNSGAATVTINIPNRAPTANAQSVTTNANTAIGIGLTGADPDGQAISFAVVTNPGHGTLTGVAPNLTYTPTAGFNGPDSFTFRTNDGSLNSLPATISITVQPSTTTTGFLKLTIPQNVINGGSTLPFVTSLADANGNAITGTPIVTCGITTNGTTRGSAPSILASSIQTSATTRGAFRLSCSRQSTTQTAEQDFVVITAAASATSQQALYSNLSRRLADTANSLDQIARALANGQPGAVPALRISLLASRVDLIEMKRSTAFAPEGGFPLSPSELVARGVASAPDDAAFNALIGNLLTKINAANVFISGLNALALTDANGAQLATFNSEINTMLTQLRALRPSVIGVTRASGMLNLLLADVLPRHQHAMVNKIAQALQQNGLAFERRSISNAYANLDGTRQNPARFYDQANPAFFGLIDLCLGNSIQGQLINLLYGDAFRQLENTMIILVGNSLLKAFVNNLALDGIITGASLSFHVFNQTGSVIEGNVVNELAGRNDVILVGPNQVDAVRTVLESPPSFSDLDSINGFFENIKAAVASFNESYQPPDDVLQNNCILGGGSDCRTALYNAGFKSVYTCSGFICLPSVMLVLVHNLDTGQWGFQIFNVIGTR
jgi:Bacterial Ig domain